MSDFPTLPEAILDLYNWPSEKGEIWRHVTDFHFVNRKGEFTSLEVYEGMTGCVLKGTLLPPPTPDNSPSAIVKRLVAVEISHFAIDFGDDDKDESRGFWLADYYGAWYKVEEPSQEYAPMALKCKEKTRKFLAFHDVIVHEEVDGEYLSTHDPVTNMYWCRYNLEQLLEISNDKYDLEFLKANACFYQDQLKNQIAAECTLMKDLKKKADAERMLLQNERMKKQAQIRQQKRSAESTLLDDELIDSDNEGDAFSLVPSEYDEDYMGDDDLELSYSDDRQAAGGVKKRKLPSEQPDLKRLKRKENYAHTNEQNQHKVPPMISEISKKVQEAGQRARAKEAEHAVQDHYKKLEPVKQGIGIKPDYVLRQEQARVERLEHQKRKHVNKELKEEDRRRVGPQHPVLPVMPMRPLGVEKHNPRSHI